MCTFAVRSLAIVATMTTTTTTTSTAYTAAARRYRRPQYSDTKIVGNFFISSPSFRAFTIFTHFKVDFSLVNLYQISSNIVLAVLFLAVCCAVPCCSVIITCDYGISTIIINEDMCSRMALLLLPILGARIQFIFNVVNFN